MSLLDRIRRIAAGARTLSRLSPEERRVLWQAWGDLLAARLGRPGATSSGTVAAPPARGGVPVDRLLALFVQAAATSAHGASCLPRSVALRRFLARYGAAARVRLGMRKTEEGWTGHAWVEHEGRVVADREEFVRQFVPFRETA